MARKAKLSCDVVIDGLERVSYDDLEVFCNLKHTVEIEFVTDLSSGDRKPILLVTKK